jgi:phosphoribosyl 1,2-cyclic phosphodiesterase
MLGIAGNFEHLCYINGHSSPLNLDVNLLSLVRMALSAGQSQESPEDSRYSHRNDQCKYSIDTLAIRYYPKSLILYHVSIQYKFY